MEGLILDQVGQRVEERLLMDSENTSTLLTYSL